MGLYQASTRTGGHPLHPTLAPSLSTLPRCHVGTETSALVRLQQPNFSAENCAPPQQTGQRPAIGAACVLAPVEVEVAGYWWVGPGQSARGARCRLVVAPGRAWTKLPPGASERVRPGVWAQNC